MYLKRTAEPTLAAVVTERIGHISFIPLSSLRSPVSSSVLNVMFILYDPSVGLLSLFSQENHPSF